MKEIQEFSVAQLRVEVCLGFLNNVVTETAHLTLESDQEVVKAFNVAVAEFETAFMQCSQNSNTNIVKEADENADESWRALRRYVNAMQFSPQAEKSELAKKVYAIIEKYGYIAKLSYNIEYGRMNSLLKEIDSLGIEAQQQLYLEAWVEDLRKCYNEFQAALNVQTNEQAAFIVGATKDKRGYAEEVYQTLVKRVNALAYINSPEQYATFIDNVNVHINRERKNISSRKTRSENDKNEEKNK